MSVPNSSAAFATLKRRRALFATVLGALAALALFNSGCSSVVAYTGQDLSPLVTRAHVHQEFGEPTDSGETDGAFYEEFQTRRKIREEERSVGLNMGSSMTFGLIEFVSLPAELYRDGERILRSETLRFEYDQSGNVMKVYLNGMYLLSPGSRQVTQVKLTRFNE
jgi:hypothetical protein